MPRGLLLWYFLLLFMKGIYLGYRGRLLPFHVIFLLCIDCSCACFALIQLYCAFSFSISGLRARLFASFCIGWSILFAFTFELDVKVANGWFFLLNWLLFADFLMGFITSWCTGDIRFFTLLCYLSFEVLFQIFSVFAHFLAYRVTAGQRISLISFSCWVKTKPLFVMSISVFMILTKSRLHSHIFQRSMQVTLFRDHGRMRSLSLIIRMIFFGRVGELDGKLIWVERRVLRFLKIFDLICLILLCFLFCLGDRV